MKDDIDWFENDGPSISTAQLTIISSITVIFGDFQLFKITIENETKNNKHHYPNHIMESLPTTDTYLLFAVV